jgi:hypothetical protein
MRRVLLCLLPALAGAIFLSRPPAQAACCYFSAVGQDVNQPAQKAFITWDPQEGVESFTVQPKFEGNARDFGMVIPTPSRPRLYEMPRDFFKELAVFTILRPVPLDRYKSFPRFGGGFSGTGGFGFGGIGGAMLPRRTTVRVVEEGVVGALDYKIVTAERSDDLYQWLKENKYSYAGDEETLGHYIQKKWVFTVMKIDPTQQKPRADGTYSGEVTPTRFTFASSRLIYPLRITQISIRDHTDALFYVQAPQKMDLPGSWSYQLTWAPMWEQALDFTLPEKITAQEKRWKAVVEPELPRLQDQRVELQKELLLPARLEWARRLGAWDMALLDGTAKFDREADPQAVRQLHLLRGHLQEGRWVTKLRKVFRRGEMTRDLEFVPATLGSDPDRMEYVYALPTSPP